MTVATAKLPKTQRRTKRKRAPATSRVRRWNNQSIASLAERLVAEYLRYKEREDWEQPGDVRLNIQEIYELVVYPEYEYQLITSLDLGYEQGKKILGKTVPEERAILIDKSIAPPNPDPCYAYTLSHEIGHCACHGDEHDPLCCSTDAMVTRRNSTRGLEAEANLFAEHLLMPVELVKLHFARCFRPDSPLRYYGPNRYWFDAFGQSFCVPIQSYTHYCETLARPLRPFFAHVSASALALKIHHLGLVLNYSGEPFRDEAWSIGSIVRNMFLS